MKSIRTASNGACLSLLIIILLSLEANSARSQSASDFTFITNNDRTNNGAITITGYVGSGGDVSIPDGINDCPVTRIGGYAFRLCSALTSVTIPNSVRRIGYEAFGYCYSLKSVAIGSGVTNIDVLAFNGDSSLTNYAVDLANPSFTSAGGVLFNKPMTLLFLYPEGLAGSYSIPNGVTSIGTYSFFSCTGLTIVTMPNTVTNLGDHAFEVCSGLTTVAIPNTVTSIGDNAFNQCGSLTDLTIGNSVTTIGYLAFSYCDSLTSVVIPASVTNISNSAFYHCGSLQKASFRGNAPSIDGGPGSADGSVFWGACCSSSRAFYVPTTTGWGATFGGLLTAAWLPQLQSVDNTGMPASCFGFNINWASGQTVMVEASTNLVNWDAVITNTLIDGTNSFCDTNWTNFPSRFYRIRSQ